MQRSTTPDRHSAIVRKAAQALRAKLISPRTFAAVISLVWRLRGNA